MAVEILVLGRDEGLFDERRNRRARQIEPPLLGIFGEHGTIGGVNAGHHRRLVVLELGIVRQILLELPDQDPAPPAAMTKMIAQVAKANPRNRAISRMMKLSPLGPRIRGSLHASPKPNCAPRPADRRYRAGASRRHVVRCFCVDSLTRYPSTAPQDAAGADIGASWGARHSGCGHSFGFGRRRRIERRCRRGGRRHRLSFAEIAPAAGKKSIDRRREPGRGRVAPPRRDQRSGVLGV